MKQWQKYISWVLVFFVVDYIVISTTMYYGLIDKSDWLGLQTIVLIVSAIGAFIFSLTLLKDYKNL